MSGDELEFQRVYETFQPKIYRYLTSLVGEEEAEDLTQEVFAKVSQSLADFRGESQLSTWLYRIATNAGIDRMRTRSFRQDARTISLDDSTELRIRMFGQVKRYPRLSESSCERKCTNALWVS